MRFRYAPLPFLVVVSLCIAAQAQHLQPVKTLAGLPGVWVLVESMKPDAGRDGLTKSVIQTAVELRLRQYGIKVLTEQEARDHRRVPHLYVNVNTLKVDTGLYAYNISVNLKQYMEIPGTTNSALGVTWGAGGVGTSWGEASSYPQRRRHRGSGRVHKRLPGPEPEGVRGI